MIPNNVRVTAQRACIEFERVKMLSVIVRHHNHQSSIIALRNILEATSNRFSMRLRIIFEATSKHSRPRIIFEGDRLGSLTQAKPALSIMGDEPPSNNRINHATCSFFSTSATKLLKLQRRNLQITLRLHCKRETCRFRIESHGAPQDSDRSAPCCC